MDNSVQDDYVHGKSQWRVGIAALRKVRNLVDGYEKEERLNRTAARYVAAGLLAALLMAIVIALWSPATLQNLLRSLS